VLAETSYSVASEIKPGSWKTGRGTPLVQLGIHHADTIAYVLGPVARTTGRLTRTLGRDLDVDDVGVASTTASTPSIAASKLAAAAQPKRAANASRPSAERE
jgi:predicted dehydrogenase